MAGPEYRQFVACEKAAGSGWRTFLMLAELRQQQMELRMAAMIGEDVGEDYLDFESMYLELSRNRRSMIICSQRGGFPPHLRRGGSV